MWSSGLLMWSASVAGSPQSTQVWLSRARVRRLMLAQPRGSVARLLLPAHGVGLWIGQGLSCQHPGSVQGAPALLIGG